MGYTWKDQPCLLPHGECGEVREKNERLEARVGEKNGTIKHLQEIITEQGLQVREYEMGWDINDELRTLRTTLKTAEQALEYMHNNGCTMVSPCTGDDLGHLCFACIATKALAKIKEADNG